MTSIAIVSDSGDFLNEEIQPPASASDPIEAVESAPAPEVEPEGVELPHSGEAAPEGVEMNGSGDVIDLDPGIVPRLDIRHPEDHTFENHLTVAGTLRARRFVHPFGARFRSADELKYEFPWPLKGMWAFTGAVFPGDIWICRQDGIWSLASDGGAGGMSLVMAIDCGGDPFIAWGEKKSIAFSVWRGSEDVSRFVKSWSISRSSGSAADDQAWSFKNKVKDFAGNIEIAHSSLEDDLGPHAKATFTANAIMFGGENILGILDF